ncbi:hypothetical protein VTO42DRAFT_8502 [Malbranchea cinnamomea]
MTSNPQNQNFHTLGQSNTSVTSSPSVSTSGKTSSLSPVPTPAAPRPSGNATKKSFAQSAVSDKARAGESDITSGQTLQHGQSPSTTSVNGKFSMQQNQPPVAGGPTIVNGNTFGDHARKPSVTISAAGTSGYRPNGGPAGRSNPIRFGSLDTPESHSTGNSETTQNQQNLGVAGAANTRITSPDASPSPIPQPLVSGGRPPSSLQGQGNNLNFGSPSGDQSDVNRSVRQVPQGPQGPLGPNAQPGHYRRESQHSAHGDMAGYNVPGGPGRGGYPSQGGRNRGYQQNQMGYSPSPGFRSTSNQHRGGPSMGHQYGQHRSYGSFNRSPAMSNANPATPPVSHVPMPGPQMPPQQYGYPQMGPQPGYAPPGGYDYYYPGATYPMPQMPYMPPSSPRPMVPHPAQPFIPGNPAQGTPLSRSPSQVSASDRPNSSLGHHQAPSISANQGHPHHPSQPTNPQPSSQFVVPPKKSGGITIRDQSGNVVTFDKATASPARATPSPVKVTTPTPTPPPQDQSDKGQSGEEKKQGFRDAIARVAENAKREAEEKKALELKQQKEKEEAEKKAAEEVKEPKEETEQKEAKETTKVEETKELKEEKQTEESKEETPAPVSETAGPGEVESLAESKEEAKAPEPAEPEEEEIDFDAIERELAEKEAAEEAAERAYQERKRKEKEEAERKAKEEAEQYEARLKQAEAEAEAREEARLKKLQEEGDEAKKEAFAALLKGRRSQTPTSTESPAAPTPESGAATPASETSMGPPQRPASAVKREKPTSLKLETVKTSEPPQPSAAMKSLQTAKFLEDPNKVSYPPSISPPVPTERRLQYNKEFLLQFQNVFKEKPFLDWENRLKETLGDGTSDTARGSPRGHALGGRGSSTRGAIPSPFAAMGTFGQGGKSQAPTPGTGDRFPGVIRAPGVGGGAFGQFPRGVGMGAGMGRTASSNAALQQPGSPRVGSHRGSTRTGSRREKSSAKKEEDTNKAMPLTANVEIKPLTTSSTGWKPRSIGQNKLAGPAPGGDGHLPPDVVQGKVKAALNKMTPEKFDKISDQILAIVAQSKDETDGRTLRQVIQLTFEKATDEAHWASMYAKFCMRMLESMSPEIKDENIRDRNGNVVAGGSLFRKYLLNRCQEEFERGWKVNLPEKPEGVTEEAAMMSDEYYRAAAAKRRGLGLVKFIGELFKLGMLTERIMHECVKKLVDYHDVPDESEIESLCSLLRTIGGALDQSEKGRSMMDAYFVRINMMIQCTAISSRHRFMLMDVVDLRKAQWKSKDAEKGPKTIQEIREEAARAQQEQEMERARQQANRGGRPPLGRGDARNYTGFGNQTPPPDYASSKVGTDDLRRLKSGRSANQPVSFAPPSMFGSRSSSGRRNLGPGGNLVRGSEDSGASSRTSTPGGKDKKDEKESASSTNAFSALAALDGDSLATSPPSNPTSPSLAKATPAVNQTKSGDKDEDPVETS